MSRHDRKRVEALLRQLKLVSSDRHQNLTDDQKGWLSEWRGRMDAVAERSGPAAAYECLMVDPIRSDILAALSGDNLIVRTDASETAARKWLDTKDTRRSRCPGDFKV